MNNRNPWRSALALNTVLAAAGLSAIFLGSYSAFAPEAGPGAASGGNSANTSTFAPADVAAFSNAAAGDCLRWDVGADGAVSNFVTTSCAEDHRFEVSSVTDLSVYPTSEFGASAPRPDLNRQAQLREELCQGTTLTYLGGKYDPAGRYSIAPILPPAEAWKAGDRTMLCGLQTTNEQGVPQLTRGKVAEVDQANVALAGQCRAIGEDQVLRTVDCSEPHQLETVSQVNLFEDFPNGYPPVADQDKLLADRCTKAAIDYLGNEENLYQSTLQPYWGAVEEASWAGGTHTINCSLMHVNPATGGFSTITGSATGGRDALNIDGAPPTPQPQRNPLRQPGQNGQNSPAASSAPAPAPGA